MSKFKVADLRAKYLPDEFTVYVDGIGTGHGVFTLAGARVGAALLIVNAGRDLYWDSATRSFHTDPTLSTSPLDAAPEQTKGRVLSWEAIIPEKELATIIIGLEPEQTANTSGDQSVGRKVVTIRDAEALTGVLGILTSAYCWYDDGSFRNSEIDVV